MKKSSHLGMIQTAILMSILTLGSKLIGFIREIVMANFFGTSYVVDAYVMASTILTVIFGGLIAAISTAYMPIFSRLCETENFESGDKFTSQIINLLCIITIGISIIGIVFSNQIIYIFASGFSGETANLASFYVKVIFCYIIFSSTSAVLESYLQYKEVFLPQIICGYLISGCTIIAIIVSAYTSSYYLAFGLLLGYLLRLIAIVCVTKKRGYKHLLDFKFGKNAKEIIKLSVPVFIGSYITYINLFIDKTLASRLVEGSISALNYASLLNEMIIGVTISILSTIVYPKLAQSNALKDFKKFNSFVVAGINVIFIIGLPCSLGAMLYSSKIIQLAYERGAFDAIATNMTASAFFYYAMGLIFIAANGFIIRIYYSMHDMKTPMITGGISVLMNIVLNFILVKYMAHNGLALSTSIAAASNTIILIFAIRIKYNYINIGECRNKAVKIFISSIVSILPVYWVYHITVGTMDSGTLLSAIQLSVVIIASAIIYFILLSYFKIDEVKLLGDIVTNKLTKKGENS